MPSRAVKWASIAVAVVTAATAAFVALTTGLPAWLPVLVFAPLMFYSENRAVEMGDGPAVSPGFMIGTAAIVAMAPEQSLLGPFIVGAVAGLEISQIRTRAWHRVRWNVAIGAFGALAGAIGYGLVPEGLTSQWPLGILAALPMMLCYMAANVLLIALASQLSGGISVGQLIRQLAPSAVESVPFAIVGYCVGRLYLDLGWSVMLLVIVPILIAREMFASYMKVKEAHDETVKMLIRALEAKDSYTAGHVERVATYAQYMGEQMAFSATRMERLRFAALMHDIGKLVVPNHILNKPGKLTEEEFARIKTHEKVTVQMLSSIEFLKPIAGAGHSDNTHFDPDDPEHPIEPYIVMIADAYDAMTSTRAYRKALPQDIAFKELRDKAGIQFHPACVEALITAIEARGEKHGAGYEVQEEFENAPEAGLGSAGLGDLLSAEA